MKVVIDTNTLINASEDDFNFGNRIVDAVLEGKIEAFANRQTLKENKFLVSKKVTDQEYLAKLEQYFDAVKLVDSEWINVVEDEEDNKILSSAITAGVDYLVTVDWHLLKLEEYQGVKIIRPEGFWGEFEAESGQGWQNWLNNFIKD